MPGFQDYSFCFGDAMTDTADKALKHDAAILNFVGRLQEIARDLDFAVSADVVDEFDFQRLQSQLQEMYRDAGRIAARVRHSKRG